MAKEDFEQVMGMHAAPMLWGVKAANMVSFRKSSFDDFDALLESYEPCFAKGFRYSGYRKERNTYCCYFIARRRCGVRFISLKPWNF